ncbi:MAG TPA: hypothetical protein VGS10_09075 [Terracidiphilus sp.]|nr:hypothetical protein [Terracidiphilus sp.]
MTRERKSPQQKKASEYTRDHFTCGESAHGFRKTWPRKKALLNREYRRKSDELLSQTKPGITADDAEVIAGEVTVAHLKKSVSRKRLHKWGPLTVGEGVKLKLEKRAEKVGWKARSHKKYEDIVAQALGTLNSLQGDQLAGAARRAFQLNLSHDYDAKLCLARSKDPVDRALHVFADVCFDNNYLAGNGYLIDSIRRNRELCTEFWRWVEKYERIIKKDLRVLQRKLAEKAATKKKVNSIRKQDTG